MENRLLFACVDSVRGPLLVEPGLDVIQPFRMCLPALSHVVRFHAVRGFGFRVDRPGERTARRPLTARDRQPNPGPGQHRAAKHRTFGPGNILQAALRDRACRASYWRLVLQHLVRHGRVLRSPGRTSTVASGLSEALSRVLIAGPGRLAANRRRRPCGSPFRTPVRHLIADCRPLGSLGALRWSGLGWLITWNFDWRAFRRDRFRRPVPIATMATAVRAGFGH